MGPVANNKRCLFPEIIIRGGQQPKGGFLFTFFVLYAVLMLSTQQAYGCGLYLKWHIASVYAPGGADCAKPQFSELYLYDLSGSRVTDVQTFSAVTPSGSPVASPPGEDISKAFDSDSGTKYLANQQDVNLIFQFTAQRCINSYMYKTANDSPCRNPATWTMYYSNDGVNYYAMDSQSGYASPQTPYMDSQLFYVLTSAPTMPTTWTPTTSPTTSRPSTTPSQTPSATPTTSRPSTSPTTSAPSQSPTYATPAIVSAKYSPDGTKIFIDFDKPTLAGRFSTAGPCLPEITVESDDLGCNNGPCPMTCQFQGTQRLVVSISLQSNMTHILSVHASEDAGFTAIVPEEEQASPVLSFNTDIQGPDTVSLPLPSVIGPTTISLCSTSSFYLTGSYGGPLQTTSVIEWLDNDVVVSNGSFTLQLVKPIEAATHKYELRVTNWIGMSTTSLPFFVLFTDDATCTASIIMPQSVSPLASQLRFDSAASLATACLSEGYTANNISFSYQWSIEHQLDEEELNITTIDNNNGNAPSLIVSPPSKLVPGVTYIIRLQVDSGIPGLVGLSETEFTLPVANPVAIISNSSNVVASGTIVLDASLSCDPNVPEAQCRATGAVKRNVIALNGLQSLIWECVDNADVPCIGSTAEISSCGNQTTCEVDVSIFAGDSPFRVRIAVQSAFTAPDVQIYSSPITVRRQLESCPLPSALEIECVRCNNRIINANEDLMLNVLGSMPEAWSNSNASAWNRTVQWFMRNSTGEFEPFQEPIGLSGTSFRHAKLVVPASQLVSGLSYTFRLVSIQQCGELTSELSSEITVSVNPPPVGGMMTISPLLGDITTWFTVSCPSFFDPDTPISYAIYRQVSSNEWIIQSPFQGSPFHEFQLPPSEEGHNLKCVAMDALGALSSLETSPSVTNIVVETPSAAQLIAFLDNFANDLKELLGRTGSSSQAMGMIGNFAEALNSGQLSQSALDHARAKMTDFLEAQSTSGTLTPDQTQGVLRTASKIAGDAPADLETEAGQNMVSSLTRVVKNSMNSLKILLLGGSVGPTINIKEASKATAHVVTQATQSFLTSDNLPTRVPATRKPTFAPTTQHGRSLETTMDRFLAGVNGNNVNGEVKREAAVQNLRSILRDIANVILADMVDGEAPRSVPLGLDMKLVAVTVSPGAIGSELQELVVPGFNETIDPPTVFYLPRDVLVGTTADLESNVNIIGIRFRFNVREMVRLGALDFEVDPLAPVAGVEEIIALDFQRPNENEPYHPEDLQEPIRIRIPLKFEQLPPNNSTQLACGYWDEMDSRWSSFGCNATNASLPMNASDLSGWLECQCNHASDYATWQAFVSDIGAVFETPQDLSTLTTIAAVLCGVLLPGIVLMWMVLSRIGRKMDLSQSRMVHLGTFVAITSRKIQLHERQRRFFRILRENQGLSAKTLAQQQREMEQQQIMVPFSEQQQNFNEETIEREYYLKAVVLYIVRGFAIGKLSAATLFLAGIVAQHFQSDYEASLVILAQSGSIGRATLPLTAVSIFICFACSIAAAVLLWREGSLRSDFRIVLMLSFFALCTSVSAMAIPLANGFTVGTGLGLVIGGTTMVMVSFLLAIGVWMLRMYGYNTRSILHEFLVNCGRGLVYEQSLLSIITRFDPYLDREKRFSLFVAIIVGNLFAASFFFALKTADDISIGLTIGTVVLCSVIVALPVKLTIRFLFKVTSARQGSAMDRVAQIFRIVAFTNDVHPAFANEAQKMDVELLHSFKKFYIAKHQLKLLEQAYVKQERTKEDLERIRRGLPPKGTYEYWLPILTSAIGLVQLIAALLFVVALTISPFAQSTQGPTIAASVLGSFSVILCVTIGVASFVLVKFRGRTTSAPKWILFLCGAHLVLFLVTILAIGILFGHDGLVPLAGFTVFITSCALTWVSQAMMLGVFYIYRYCVPEAKRIRRFYRTLKSNEMESDDEKYQYDVDAALHEHQRLSSSRQSSKRALAMSLTSDEMESYNPIARKEVSDAAGRAVVDKRTGEFELNASTLSKDFSVRVGSSRLDKNVSGFERITHHAFLASTLKQSNGMVTTEILQLARANLEQSKKELKKWVKLSRIAWMKLNPMSLSAKQLAVRREKTLMLKLATLLAEDTSRRPKPVKRWLPDKLLLVSWVFLFFYYLGGLTWIAFWIFSRDGQSRQNLIDSGISEPTPDQVTQTTNAVLVSWLGAAFFSVAIGYFVVEPLLIFLRYGFLPLILKLYRPHAVASDPSSSKISSIHHQLDAVDPEAGQTMNSEEGQTSSCCCYGRLRGRNKSQNHARNDAQNAAAQGAIFDAITDFLEAIA